MEKKREKGLPTYPGFKSTYFFLFICIIMETGAIIAQSYFLARAITFLFAGKPFDHVLTDVGLFFIMFIIRYIFVQIEDALAEKYARQTGAYLRNTLLRRYFEKPSHLMQQMGTGHLVELLMEGIDNVKKYVEIIAIRMFKTLVIPAAIVIYIFFHDKTAAIILVASVPIVIIFMILLGIAAQKMADSQYTMYTRLANHFIDSLKGLETLTYLGKSKAHRKRITAVSEDYRKSTMKTLRIAFLSSFALDFFTSLSIAFVAVSLGLRLVNGEMLLLPALTILLLAPEYFSPIKQVGKDYHATLDGQIAMAHIHTWLDDASDKPASKQINIPDKPNSLTLKDVNVQINEQALIQQASMQAKKGFHAIVGASGAGKTTLLQVLAGRLEPQSGSLTINQTALDHLHHDAWLEKIAYIPQHPYIFPISLADNIRFYKPEASDEAVTAIIEKIGLKALVDSFPNGMHEPIGEGGRTLSGGQEQRIALARALLSDQAIILLDEPTAHIDIETEYELKQVILQTMQDKFVFISTHRLHWVNHVDTVSFLADGQIVAQDTHKQLFQKNSAYRNFFKGQKGGNRHA